MTRANKALAVMVVVSLGLWGCAQEQNHGSSTARIRALENKNAKLEDDYRALLAARDQIRAKLNSVEEQKAGLEQQVEQIQVLTKEREELKQQVSTRTSERDSLQTQMDQVKKSIRTLLGQVEAASNAVPGQPVTSVTKTKTDEKS